jgi:hypothetical protein
VEQVVTEIDRLKKALTLMYDKWENGTSCYENPEECEGFLGFAFKLTQKEEKEILSLIVED